MSKNITGVITWLKDWFYDEGEVDTLLSNKVDKVSGKGLSTNDFTTQEKNKLSGLSNYSHPVTHSSSMIVEESTLSGINTQAGSTQHLINVALGDHIANLRSLIQNLDFSVELYEVVDQLGTASSSTMNKIYCLISDDEDPNNTCDIYITLYHEQDDEYSWERIDAINLNDITLSWNRITNKPSTFAPSSHGHDTSEIESTISTGSSVIHGTLDDHLDYLNERISGISSTGEMADVLTHINTNYDAYQ